MKILTRGEAFPTIEFPEVEIVQTTDLSVAMATMLRTTPKFNYIVEEEDQE